MIRKNKKFIDPRYFMDEKRELNENVISDIAQKIKASGADAKEWIKKNSRALATVALELDTDMEMLEDKILRAVGLGFATQGSPLDDPDPYRHARGAMGGRDK